MSAAQPQRYRLPRTRILRGREAFRALFEKGQGFRSGDILFKYRTVPQPAPADGADVLTAFIVSRKHGGAVRRNRTRRLMREAWRLARPDFAAGMAGGTELHLALIWVGAPAAHRTPEFERIRRDIDKGLKRLAPSLSGDHAP